MMKRLFILVAMLSLPMIARANGNTCTLTGTYATLASTAGHWTGSGCTGGSYVPGTGDKAIFNGVTFTLAAGETWTLGTNSNAVALSCENPTDTNDTVTFNGTLHLLGDQVNQCFGTWTFNPQSAAATANGTWSYSSASVSLASVSGTVAVGQAVWGAGIYPGTLVSAISGTALTLTCPESPCTYAGGSSTPLSFFPASILYDSSGAGTPSTDNAIWNIGSSNCTATCALLQVNGTSSAPVLFAIATGSGNFGGFPAGTYQGSGNIRGQWILFNNCATNSTACTNTYSYGSVGLNSSIAYSTYTSSGVVELGSVEAGNSTTFNFTNNAIVNPINSSGYGLILNTAGDDSTISGLIAHNYIEGQVHETIGNSSYWGTDDGLILSQNVMLGTSSVAPYNGALVGHATGHFDGNMFYDNVAAAGSSFPAISMTRAVLLEVPNASGSAHLYCGGPTISSVINGFTAERQYNDISGWYGTSVCMYMQTGSSVQNFTYENGLILPAPNGYASMQLSTLASVSCDNVSTFCPIATAVHNTLMTIPAASGFGTLGGEENVGHANLYQTVENNIFWMTPSTAGAGCDTGWVSGFTPVNGTFGTVNYNDQDGVTGSPYSSVYCGASAWYNTTPGVNDLTANPNFSGCYNGSTTSTSNCNFSTWGSVQGISVSSWADIMAQFRAMNAPNPALVNVASILNYYYWVRQGFTPTNAALHGTASDGGDIGGIPYLAPVPPQFTSLLTSTTDLTTSPSWTTPSVPASGGSYVDSIFGITANRIPAVNSNCPVNNTYNPTGNCSITNTFMQVDYAKTVPWSVNENYYIGYGNGWLYLYSRSSGGVYSFIRVLRTYCSAISTPCTSNYGSSRDYGSGDESFSGALWGDGSNWLWANNSSSNPNVIYYTGSSSTNPAAFQLKAYNAATDSISVIHDFTPTINTVNSWGTCSRTATSVDMQREGNQSDDDRFWALGVTDGTSSGWCAVLVYDKTLDSVIALQTLGANGMCGVPACSSLFGGEYPNWVGMSPSGKYVIVNWQNGASDPTWSRGEGTEIYTNTLSYLGVASAYNGHGDVGWDANGLEVYVDGSSEIYAYSNYAMEVCALDAVNGNSGPNGCRRYLSLPCTWANTVCPVGSNTRDNTYFISMRGTHGAALGQMLISTQTGGGPGYNLSTGNGGWGALENDAVYIDWANGSMSALSAVPPSTTVTRLGRNHAIYAYDSAGDGDYGSQANTAANRLFNKFAWTSNMDQVPNGNCISTSTPCNYYSMYAELSSTPQVSSLTFAPIAGTYGSAQTVAISTSTAGATICYTTDGSTPTESGNVCSGGTTQTYSSPITVSTTKTVNALGTLSGYTDSYVASALYTITGGGSAGSSAAGIHAAGVKWP